MTKSRIFYSLPSTDPLDLEKYQRYAQQLFYEAAQFDQLLTEVLLLSGARSAEVWQALQALTKDNSLTSIEALEVLKRRAQNNLPLLREKPNHAE